LLERWKFLPLPEGESRGEGEPYLAQDGNGFD